MQQSGVIEEANNIVYYYREQLSKNNLFLSFKDILSLIKDDSITPHDLRNAMFYFGCTRSQLAKEFYENKDVTSAFDLSEPEEYKRAIHLYDIIRSALLDAEKQGRAVFRLWKKSCSYTGLNDLLERNGFDTSSVKHLESQKYSAATAAEHYKSLVNIILRNSIGWEKKNV